MRPRTPEEEIIVLVGPIVGDLKMYSRAVRLSASVRTRTFRPNKDIRFGICSQWLMFLKISYRWRAISISPKIMVSDASQKRPVIGFTDTRLDPSRPRDDVPIRMF